MKNKKILAWTTGIIGAIGIFLPYIDILTKKSEITFFMLLGTGLVLISGILRSLYHRGDEIEKTFEKASEKGKDKIYNIAIEVKKEEKIK